MCGRGGLGEGEKKEWARDKGGGRKIKKLALFPGNFPPLSLPGLGGFFWGSICVGWVKGMLQGVLGGGNYFYFWVSSILKLGSSGTPLGFSGANFFLNAKDLRPKPLPGR